MMRIIVVMVVLMMCLLGMQRRLAENYDTYKIKYQYRFFGWTVFEKDIPDNLNIFVEKLVGVKDANTWTYGEIHGIGWAVNSLPDMSADKQLYLITASVYDAATPLNKVRVINGTRIISTLSSGNDKWCLALALVVKYAPSLTGGWDMSEYKDGIEKWLLRI